MKIWRKSRERDFGQLYLTWRHRSGKRFFMKIGTWILGGFVIGILTSIVMHFLGLDDYAINAARLAFFISWGLGVMNAYLRNLYYGYEYRVTEKALLAVRPLVGLESINKQLGKTLGQKYEYLPWSEIKDAKEEETDLALSLKNIDEMVKLGVSVVIFPDGRRVETDRNSSGSGEKKHSPEAARIIAQKIREVKKG